MFQHFVGTKVSHEGGSKVVWAVDWSWLVPHWTDAAPLIVLLGLLIAPHTGVFGVFYQKQRSPWTPLFLQQKLGHDGPSTSSLWHRVSQRKNPHFEWVYLENWLAFSETNCSLEYGKCKPFLGFFSQNLCQLKICLKMVISLGQMVRGQKSPRLGLLWHTFYAR